MRTSRRLHYTRIAVWSIVIGGHVLLLVLFSSTRPRDRHNAAVGPEPRTILLLLDMAPPPIEAPSEPLAPFAPSVARVRVPLNAASLGQAITPDESAPPPRSPVDWYSEAEEVAKDRGSELLAQQRRDCDPSSSDRPGSLLPKCGKKKREAAEWEPEPKRAGFSGGLPYVRLGKRCVVALGFFGCALGTLPEADGHVFDDMKDPDRPRSSVPDIPGHE
jgi:hypothetical protein